MHKLTVSLLLAVIVSIVGLGWGLDQLFSRYGNQPQSEGLFPYQLLGAQIALTLDQQLDADVFVQGWNQSNDKPLTLTDRSEFLLPPELRHRFETNKSLILESVDGVTLNFLLVSKQQVLSLVVPISQNSLESSPLNLIFTLVFYIGILTIVLLWLYPLIRRLSTLRETARIYGEGDLTLRVKTNSTSYISDIEREFNRMAQRIETLVSDNKLLSKAVSHDLRTPLARLRFGVDMLTENQDPVLQERYKNRIDNDIEEMESLVELLLSYTRFEESAITLENKPLSLVALVSECVELVDECQPTLAWVEPAVPGYILGDTRYISIVINNLLQNAIRFAKTTVRIDVIEELTRVVLRIDDNGNGIPPDSRQQVLKPFVRGENPSGSKGYGMGLAFVARIVEWYDAEIEIADSQSLLGASIIIAFPKYEV